MTRQAHGLRRSSLAAPAAPSPPMPAPDLPLVPESPGLLPLDLLEIFYAPTRFFSTRLAAGSTPYLLLVGWCYGIADAMDRIDRMLLQAEMGGGGPLWQAVGPAVTGSWPAYWAFCLPLGAFSGAFLYFVGGWWYRVRLKWAGDPEPHGALARRVYMYSAFVMAAPLIVVALVQTVAFPDYGAAWRSDEIYTLVLIIFPFWSIGASYAGVRALFRVGPWKARLWFLILPVLAYLVAFGALAAGAALLGA